MATDNKEKRALWSGTVFLDDMLTLSDVKEMFGMSEMTIRKWRRDHGFPTTVISGKMRHTVRFDRANVLAWANTHKKVLVHTA